jgi:uncharacterized damage-inducible protein DinB
MEASEISLLSTYNRWAQEKVLAACRGLSAAELNRPVQASFGSLLGTLAHILGAEEVWRRRLQEGVSPERMVSAGDFTDLAALEAYWQSEAARLDGFVAGLDAAALQRKVHFRRMGGDLEETTVWKALLHVVLHGMQFRAEAGAILAGFGRSPGDIDLIYYLRETGQR